ncbi:MAG: hypothetical protein IGS39_10490 [Calothrix sp. C42_A2020_038]|nr:hypothetical protein [Calothrix sp. C42_A2020_038]
MTYMQVVLDFITCKFPYWGACNFRFEPRTKTMFIQCLTPEGRKRILADAQTISTLDINVKKFVVTFPKHSDVVIATAISRRVRES